MVLSNATLLPMINFFHFVAAGVVIPVLSRQIVVYGGNHIILGSVQSLVFIAHMVSKDFIELFENGKKQIIKLSLYSCLVYYVMLIFAAMWWLIALIRIAYALTSQVLQYSKEFAARTEPRHRKTKINNMIDIMRVIGLTVGSMAGGFIYDRTKNATNNAIVGSILGLISVILLHQTHYEDFNVMQAESQIFTYQKSVFEQLENLRNIKFRNMWPRVILKMSYVLTFVTFFSRFIFVLCHNYKVNSVIVGWVRGYHYILRFLASFLAPFLIEQTKNKRSLFAHSMVISAVSLVALFYAPTYKCYLICFIPLMFSYTVVSSLLNEDILNFKSDVNVYLATQTCATIINMLSPITHGIIRQAWGPVVSKIATVAPTCIWAYLLHQNIFSQKRTLSRYSVYATPSLRQIFDASYVIRSGNVDDDGSNEEVLREDEPDDDTLEGVSEADLGSRQSLSKQSGHSNDDEPSHSGRKQGSHGKNDKKKLRSLSDKDNLKQQVSFEEDHVHFRHSETILDDNDFEEKDPKSKSQETNN